MTSLPALEAWLFDLDGVLTDTARVHALAWQATFDQFLAERVGDEAFVPFDRVGDYEQFVDGKPRCDGVRDFLASRGITVAEGRRSDGPDVRTVWGIGNRKNDRLLEFLAHEGPTVFAGSVEFVRAVRDRGVLTAVVSASENCTTVLAAARITELFDVVVDGLVASAQHLAGKPAPDTYLYAARQLGVAPRRAAVVEDAPAGVAAGHAGDFGLVVGVSRGASPAELEAMGATIVVCDLAELLSDARAPRSGALPRHDERC